MTHSDWVVLSNADRMRTAPMHFVLCYPKLSPADAEAIEAFRRQHEPARAKMVRPHVTLVFGVTSVSVGALAKLAATIATKTAPFDFAINGMEVEAHEKGDHNLFLKVGDGADKFMALYRALYAGPLAAERGDIEFSPHVTIATNADLSAVVMAAKEAKHLTAIGGRIDTLDVVTLNGGVLNSIASLPLGD